MMVFRIVHGIRIKAQSVSIKGIMYVPRSLVSYVGLHTKGGPLILVNFLSSAYTPYLDFASRLSVV